MISAYERAVNMFWDMSGREISLKDYKDMLKLDACRKTREMIAVATKAIEVDRHELLAWEAEQQVDPTPKAKWLTGPT